MTAVEVNPSRHDDTAEVERERLQGEILDRMILCFRASQTQQPTQAYNPWLEQRVSVMTAMAKLFLGFPIPLWPPHLLLRKIVRRLVLPLFAPQVEFNTATRDVILEMRQRSEAQAAALQDAVQHIARLEEQIEVMTVEIEGIRPRSNTRSGVSGRS